MILTRFCCYYTTTLLLLFAGYCGSSIDGVTYLKRNVIDIGASIRKHDVVSAHPFSRRDTTTFCFGIGKGIPAKALKDDHILSLLELPAISQQAAHFMTACYSQVKFKSTTEALLKVRIIKIRKSYS